MLRLRQHCCHPIEHSVLVLDDEQNILNAIRRELSTPPLGRYR
jgi:hypothetical protein